MAEPAHEEPREPQEPDEAQPGTASALAGLAILGAMVAAVAYGIVQLAPDNVREKAQPGFIDNIFANNVVLAAARVVVLFAAVVALAGGIYIAASMAVRMSRGEWLRRAGPFESQVIEDKLNEASGFFDDWMEALESNEDLEARLAERDATIQALLEERAILLEVLEEHEADKP